MDKRRKLGTRILSTQNWEALLRLRGDLEQVEARIQASHDSRRRKEEEAVISKIKSDPSVFYSYAKEFVKTPTQVEPLQVDEGGHTTNQKEMAEILKHQYNSVFSVPTEEVSPMFLDSLFQDNMEEVPKLESISFSVEKVEVAIASLSNSTAPGPNGIPTLCYKWGDTW